MSWKRFVNDRYMILFNKKTGLEMLSGINGHKDPFVTDLPTLLDIGIMGSCHNACSFCYQGHIKQPNMRLKDFKRIIDQVKHHVTQVALGGRGDPNKHENFKEIVEYCVKNEVVPSYTTSGINLTEDEIEISKMCGAVAVSDYEWTETYRALTNLINAGVKTNIHQIFSKKTFQKCIDIITGVNPWEHCSNCYRAPFPVKELNAVIFLLFKPQGAGKRLDLIPKDYHLQHFADVVFTPKAPFKIGMDSCLVNHVTKYVTPTDLQAMSIDTCEGARMSAYITPDMKMMPCSFGNKIMWGCDIRKNSIQDVWQNKTQFKVFRSSLKKERNNCPYGL